VKSFDCQPVAEPVALSLTWRSGVCQVSLTVPAHAQDVGLSVDTQVDGGRAGVPYNQPLSVSGGTPPYTWALAGVSTPPDWLSLSPVGMLSGTPPSAGPVALTVIVTDSSAGGPLSTSQSLGFVIAPPGV